MAAGLWKNLPGPLQASSEVASDRAGLLGRGAASMTEFGARPCIAVEAARLPRTEVEELGKAPPPIQSADFPTALCSCFKSERLSFRLPRRFWEVGDDEALAQGFWEPHPCCRPCRPACLCLLL